MQPHSFGDFGCKCSSDSNEERTLSMYTKTPDSSTLNAPITVSNFPILRVFKNSKRPAELRGIYAAVIGRKVNFDAFNAGVRCGGGLVVIDVDPRNGGMGSYGNLCSGYGNLSDECSWIVDTPSAGFHLYFTYDHSAYRVSKGTLGAGIDVLGDGCYALIPPSSIDGKSYIKREHVEGIGQEGISKAPLWLLELVGVPLVGGKVNTKDYPLGGGGTREGRDREVEAREGIRGEAGEGMGATLGEAVVVLSRINPDCRRDDWLRIGMGLKHPSGLGDTPTARNTWILWSKGEFTQAWDPSSPHAGLAKKFNAKDCIRVWNSIKNRSGGSESGAYSPITWASVVKLSLISSRELNSLTTLTTTTKEPIMHTTEETAMKLQSEQEAPNNTELDQTFPLKENALSKQTFPLKENVVSKMSLARSVDVSTQKSTHRYYSRTAGGYMQDFRKRKIMSKPALICLDYMSHRKNPELYSHFQEPFPYHTIVLERDNGTAADGQKVMYHINDNMEVSVVTKFDLMSALSRQLCKAINTDFFYDIEINAIKRIAETFILDHPVSQDTIIPYVSPNSPMQLCHYRSKLNPCDGPTPAWDEVLKCVKTQTMREQLMAFIAILLLHHDTKLLQYIIMTGGGGLGKSSVMNALARAMGSAHAMFSLDDLKYSPACIETARFLSFDEMSNFRFLESDFFKALTGSHDGSVTLQHKFGKPFKHTPDKLMVMMACNKIPVFENDSANLRRIIPIQFARPKTGRTQIHNMEQCLREELSHFAYKCQLVLNRTSIKDSCISSIEDSRKTVDSAFLDSVKDQLGLILNPLGTVPTSMISKACAEMKMGNIATGNLIRQLAAEPQCAIKILDGKRYLLGYQSSDENE